MSNFDPTLYNTNNDNKTFNPTLDKNNLEDRLFLTLINKNLNYCIDKNADDTHCTSYYNNLNGKINKVLKNEYNDASSYVYSNPVNFEFKRFPSAYKVQCDPEFGKNRTKKLNAIYTFPIGNAHDPYIAEGFPNDINNIKSLKPGMSKMFTNVQTKDSVKFTRMNDTVPESFTMEIIYSCPDKPYRTSTDIDKIWSERTNCPMSFSNVMSSLGTSYDALQYTPNSNDITNLFGRYNKKNMYKSPGIVNIQNCYGNSKYLPIDATDLVDSKGNVLPDVMINYTLSQGVEFSNAKGSVPVVFSGDYKLWFQDDGNLVLYNKGRALWHTATFTSGIGVLRMQYDGNLTLGFPSGKGDWSTGTFGNPYNAFLYLEQNGSINIKDNRNGNIIKKIHISNEVAPSVAVKSGPSH